MNIKGYFLFMASVLVTYGLINLISVYTNDKSMTFDATRLKPILKTKHNASGRVDIKRHIGHSENVSSTLSKKKARTITTVKSDIIDKDPSTETVYQTPTRTLPLKTSTKQKKTLFKRQSTTSRTSTTSSKVFATLATQKRTKSTSSRLTTTILLKTTLKTPTTTTKTKANAKRKSSTTTTLKTSPTLTATTTTTEAIDLCPHPTLPHKTDIATEEKITCQPNSISPESCDVATKTYPYAYRKHQCGTGNGIETINICQFVAKNVRFKCNYKACGSTFNQSIFIHVFTDESGWHEPLKPGYNDSKSLENAVLKHVKEVKIAQDFVFLSCAQDNKDRTQLLHFDSAHFKKSVKKTIYDPNNNTGNTGKDFDELPEMADKVNINVIWLDSLSRRHFYRSLHKTIERITEINLDKSTKAEILDFELMQAVHGHTHENLIAFFEGRVLPKEKRGRQPDLNNLLRFMRQSGYKNLYQEDMCYRGYWGFNKVIGAGKKWQNIVKGINKLAIDDTGLTFASCKMIESHTRSYNIFNDVKDFCYNGLNFNTYFVRHTGKKLKTTPSNLFLFSLLCIPHDAGGHRVQGFDHGLAEFVTEMSQLKNTITFLFADHGNTYTWYASRLDGRYEQHNPHFFTILPEDVIGKIGKSSVDALRKNRVRMVTLIDLQHTIRYLANTSYHDKGLLNEVSVNRTCSNVELSTPNYCVCKGWHKPEHNKTFFWPFVEFAVGHLNNLITDASPSAHCKRLVPTSFENLSTKSFGGRLDDEVNLSLDVVAKPGSGSSNTEERFSFQIKFQRSSKLETFKSEFKSYSRTTTYGGYKKCSDTNANNLKLCICDLNGIPSNKNTSKLHRPLDVLHRLRTDYNYTIKRSDCFINESISVISEGYLNLLRRDVYEKTEPQRDRTSTTFEVLNHSLHRTYEVIINFTELVHMKPVENQQQCKGTVKPSSIRYLCTLSRTGFSGHGNFTYEVKYIGLFK